MYRKVMSGRIEDLTIFLRRKYCDRKCMAIAFTKETPTLGALRKRAERFREFACQECGVRTDLHIHHIDSNPANNEPSNLMTLCGSCHQRWHWARTRLHRRHKPLHCVICGKSCDRLHRKMCQKHWQRFKKYGNPYLTKRAVGRGFVLVDESPQAGTARSG